MATSVPDRANWRSPWPKGHPNYHEEVTPEQQSQNLLRANPTKFHELRKNRGVPDSVFEKTKDTAVNWRSPWPKGHPNYHEEVK